MATKAEVKKEWDPIAKAGLASKFGKEAWWKESKGCSNDTREVPCDNVRHIRTFGHGMVLHKYRHLGWKPLRIYERLPNEPPVTHTPNSFGRSGGDPGVYADGGNTMRDGRQTRQSPIWPEVGDTDSDGKTKVTKDNLKKTRRGFVANAWSRTNDMQALFKFIDSIKCKKHKPPCKKEVEGVEMAYVMGNAWQGVLPAGHNQLAVCVKVGFICKKTPTITKPERGGKPPRQRQPGTPPPPPFTPPGFPPGPTTPGPRRPPRRTGFPAGPVLPGLPTRPGTRPGPRRPARRGAVRLGPEELKRHWIRVVEFLREL